MTVLGLDYLFIHVPKNAGKSVTRRLVGWGINSQALPAHVPLSFFDKDILQNRFSFGFVRNPWDRAVSMYTFSRSRRKHMNVKNFQAAQAVPFKEWLMEGFKYNSYDDHVQSRTFLQPVQRRSQMYWLNGCSFIGKVENLTEDLEYIESRITLEVSPFRKFLYGNKPPHRNKSARGDYRAYFDDESAGFVAKYFSEEINLFSYKFD